MADRTPYEIAERKADIEYITDLIENKPWAEVLEGLEKYIKLREVRQEMRDEP